MKNEDLLISIIIVTYNVEDIIDNCINSVTKNTFKNYELIIIDGSSNDGTVSKIKKHGKRINYFISEKDNGIYDAMSKGTAIASGKFILFLGADDQLLINVQELSNILVDEKTIYYGNVVLSSSNKIYGGKFNKEKLINRNICHQSIFYPKKVFKDFEFNKNYKYMADYAMNLKLWSLKSYRFQYINKLISIYSVEGLSSTIIDAKFKKDSFKLIYKYFGLYGVFIKLFNKFRNLLENKIIK